ncbi:MAG: glycosyltransferase [Calditrichaeota bacterium]|nr:glycosyltransferase [Calditrichota bacterium]
MTVVLLYGLLILFIIALFFLYRGFGALKSQTKTSAPLSVSVIVCAHNEEKNLPDCLKRLKQQIYPENLVEFIIVNDRSADRTPQIIARYLAEDHRFKSVTITDRVPDFAPKKRAIDTAIKQAKGEIILLTDADGRPGPYWVKTMVSYFTPDTDMVIGYAPYAIKPANHFIKKLLALEYFSHAAVAAASAGLGAPLTCVGTNMAYRKKVYYEIGGFGRYKKHISGDDDLFLTLVREAKRYKIKYAIDGKTHVFNNPPRLWSKFLHQRMRYASKGFDYPFRMTFGLTLYYLFNLLLVAKTGYYLFSLTVPANLLIVWVLKMLSEFIFINRAASVLEDRRAIWVFPFAALLHPFYVVVFGAIGQLGYFRWAEQEVEAAVQKPAIEKE